MNDFVSSQKRSEIMKKIHSENTKIEVQVRRWLFSNGFRYRKNDKRYLGKPDIVLPKYKTIVFVNGCFWHAHEDCKYFAMPKSNTDYWHKKLNKNKSRDKEIYSKLSEDGWKVIIIWECELKKNPEKRLKKLIDEIRSE